MTSATCSGRRRLMLFMVLCSLLDITSSCTEISYADSFPYQFVSEETYQCPSDWVKRGTFCYFVSDVALSWEEANVACSSLTNGGELVQIEEHGTNLFIGGEVSKQAAIKQYWIGLRVMSTAPTVVTWANGEESSLGVGQWSAGQPDSSIGECTSVEADDENQYPWALTWCETPLPFVCQIKACLQDEFRCVSGACIPAEYECDGTDDCGDGSDEEDCSTNCHMLETGESGTIRSPGNPSNYDSYSQCQWIIQVPVGKQVTLKFNDFTTEENLDVVDIYVGGRTIASSVFAGSLSGQLNNNLPTFVSTNNLMIVVFSSDRIINFRGFSAQYYTTFRCFMDVVPGFIQPDDDPISSSSVSSASECRSFCENNAQCDAFTYTKSPRRCTYHKDIRGLEASDCCDYWAKTCPGQTGTPVLDSVPNGSGGELIASATPQPLSSPLYPVGYLVNTKVAWLISAPTQWDIITLQLLDVDLGPGDTLTIYDSNQAMDDRVLATYSMDSSNVPAVLISSAQHVYVFLDTSSRETGRGYQLLYATGCDVTLEDVAGGNIISPGFERGSYPNFLSCTWTISSLDDTPLRVKFSSFELEESKDYLKIYEGENAQGTAFHSGTGFTGATNIADLTADTGKLYMEFKSDETGSAAGFNMSFSIDCPDPEFNETITEFTGDKSNSYGSSFAVFCAEGYYFAQQEFQDCEVRPLVVGKEVSLECLMGGVWNIDRIPQCSPVYCGLPPSVNNGYIAYASSVFYGGQVNYTCFAGFQLSSTAFVKCDEFGVWGSPPTCDADTCSPAPSDPDNGNFTIVSGEGSAYGSVVEYQCFPGYQMRRGNPIVYCSLDSDDEPAWSMGMDVECAALPCIIPDIPQGQTSLSGVVRTGETVTVTCDEGYQLNTTGDEYIMTCMGDQMFDYVPLCEDKNECLDDPCQAVVGECENTMGSFKCSCQPGFELLTNGINCGDINECATEKGDCRGPDESASCQNAAGSYQCACRNGYQLYEGDGFNGFSLYTGETGLKRGDILRINHTCVERTCEDLGAVENGMVLLAPNKKTFYYNDSVTVQCKLGYVVAETTETTSVLTCQADGEWDVALPTCEAVKCQFSLEDGLRNAPTWSPTEPVGYGETVTLNCTVPGLDPEKFQRTQKCLYDGKLMEYRMLGDPQECGVIDCGVPEGVGGLDISNVPDDTTYDASFVFTCLGGFEKIGNSSEGNDNVRCREDGRWDFFDLRCTGPQCSDPGRPADGYQEFLSYEEGQTVKFLCDRPGFNATPAAVTCMKQANNAPDWDMNTDAIQCRDVEPPTFPGCDAVEAFYVKKYEQPPFAAPPVDDNSGGVDTLEIVEGQSLNDRILEDTVFTWKAVDHNANEAQCVYDVKLNDEKPPIFPEGCAATKTVYVYNENDRVSTSVEIVNVTASTSDITVTSRLLPTPTLEYGRNELMSAFEFQQVATDALGNQATCLSQIVIMPAKCKPAFVRTPRNGAKSSSQLMDEVSNEVIGWKVTVSCNAGYGFYNQPPEIVYECREGEDFMNKELGSYVPDCVAREEAKFTQEQVVSYGMVSSANQAAYVAEIKTKLATAANDLEAVCTAGFGSSLQTPEITVQYLGEEFLSSMLVTYGIKYTDDGNDNVDSCRDLVTSHFKSIDSLRGARVLHDITPNGLATVSGFYRETPVDMYECNDGQLLVQEEVEEGADVTYCIPCPAGTYSSNGTCVLCPLGTYNDVDSQEECMACPNGTYTYSTGASSQDMCRDECPPPFISSTRLPPCELCPRDTYWSAADTCEACPADTITRDDYGAVNKSMCHGQCPAGEFSHDGHLPCRPCPTGMYQDATGQLECRRCPNDLETTLEEGATSSDMCTDNTTAICLDIDCGENGTCEVIGNNAQCVCSPGFTGSRCEVNIDECASNPCYYGGTCVDGENEYTCHCISVIEYRMKREEMSVRTGAPLKFITAATTIEECEQACLDDPVCKQLTFEDSNTGQTCAIHNNIQAGINRQNVILSTKQKIVIPQFNGSRCELEQNDCPAEVDGAPPCLNEGQCRDLVQDYECVCPANNEYFGPRCADKVDPCDRLTCDNGGTCEPISSIRAVCRCKPGYTGETCETDIDDCSFSPCMYGGTCKDRVNGFTCDCPTGFSGSRCETKPSNLCSSNDCTSYGKCYEDYTTSYPPAPVCYCDEGHTNDKYWTRPYNDDKPTSGDGDSETLAQHGQVCRFGKEPVAARCRVAGTGVAWNDPQSSDKVFQVPCTNDGGLVCLNNNQTDEMCEDYEVQYLCEVESSLCVEVDECLDEQCENGASCSDKKTGYRCQCQSGYEGHNCQRDRDNCASMPCKNGATCSDLLATFNCTCVAGYAGKACQNNIDDCADDPCDSVGSVECEDLVDDYECICKDGYTSKNCSVNFDECLSEPCHHGGNCTDLVNGFSCQCERGWEGPVCADRADVCASNPCKNNADCFNMADGYYCACPPGFFGGQCEDGPQICSVANPCVNGGECQTDGTCTCSPDFVGSGCECERDYCGEENICESGGTCRVENLGGYSCQCQEGFQGDRCETNVDDCSGRSCGRGECVDGVGTAFCDCPIGYTGPSCNKADDPDVDMCFYGQGGATSFYPFTLTMTMTLGVWVRFLEPGDMGTFLTLYGTRSQTSTELSQVVARFSYDSVLVSYYDNNGDMMDAKLSAPSAINLNDGQWHYVVLLWAGKDVELKVDSVQADTSILVGFQALPEYGLIRLGNYEDAMTGGESDMFSGCVSLVQMWNATLTDQALAEVFNAENEDAEGDTIEGFEPMLLLSWSWGSYSSGPGLQKSSPSTRGLDVCSNGQCTTERSPPRVNKCPADHEEQIEKLQYVNANWTALDIFGAADSLSQNRIPPVLLATGHYPVVHNAWADENMAGSRAVCEFNVFVRLGKCEDPDVPAGVSSTCDDDATLPFSRSCELKCTDEKERFVFPVPKLYTCGPLGTWNTENPRLPMKFPTCGALGDSNLALSFGWTFDLTANVNDALINQLESNMMNKLKAWNDELKADGAGFAICKQNDCSDLTITVEADADKNALITIAGEQISTELGDSVVTADAVRQAVIGQDTFRDSTVPGADSINPDTFFLEQEFSCEDNYHVVGTECVECSAGTYYDAASKTCKYCDFGSYQPDAGKTECIPCGDGKTTENCGAVSLEECYDTCAAGSFYDTEAKQCTECPKGFYQENEGCTYCLPCSLGKTTPGTLTDDADKCFDECPDGTQLGAEGECEECPRGTYRTVGLQNVCERCETGYTTEGTGSKTAAECTVVVCPAGEVRVPATETCDECPANTYRSDTMAACESCGDPSRYRTETEGSTSKDDCKFYCPAGLKIVTEAGTGDEEDVMSCEVCPEDTYKEEDKYYATECTPCPDNMPTTVGNGSTSEEDCRFAKCTEGQVVDAEDPTKCISCSYGTYQPNSRPTTDVCIDCPEGTSTNKTEAGSKDDCMVFCPSGQELEPGTSDCRPCNMTSYKDNKDSTENEIEMNPNARFEACTPCDNNLVTNKTGAASESECNIANCQPGTNLSDNYRSCVECPMDTYQDKMWQPECKACPEESSTGTGKTGADSVADCNVFPNRQVAKINLFMDVPWTDDYLDSNSAAYKSLQARLLKNLQASVLDKVDGFRGREDLPDLPGSPTLIALRKSSGTTVAVMQVELAGESENAVQDFEDELEEAVKSGSLKGPAPEVRTFPKLSDSWDTFVTAPGDPVVYCENGQKFDFGTDKCVDCEMGEYQQENQLDVCHVCPARTSTRAAGSVSMELDGSDVCFASCPAGSEGVSGSSVCTPCPKGSYKATSGPEECTQCDAAFTTVSTGTKSSDMCIAECPVGQYSKEQVCEDCPRNKYNDLINQVSCKSCPEFYRTTIEGATAVQDCVNVCTFTGTEVYCQNNGTCTFDAISRKANCECLENYVGDTCAERQVPGDGSNIPYIIGGTIGGLVLLILLLLLIAYCCRRPPTAGKTQRLQEYPMYPAQQPEPMFVQAAPSQAGYYPSPVFPQQSQIGTPTNAAAMPYMFYEERDMTDYGAGGGYGNTAYGAYGDQGYGAYGGYGGAFYQ